MKDFKNLAMWNRSHALTLKIYYLTKSHFPKDELFSLSSQIRRSSASIPTNIAEGCGRNSDAELRRFLIISTGSCSELEYQLLLAHDLGYLPVTIFESISEEVIEIRKMLYSYIKKL